MSAAIRMLWFHTRLFARNSYFTQLMFTSTLTILAMQLLAAHGNDVHADEALWLRAALVGTWSVCTVAAGMIGYQRFQGTLAHLVFTPGSPSETMLSLVGSAATFGLLTFPLAALVASAFGHAPSARALPALLVGIPVFWVACLSISVVVSAVFVLTPNAITYEGLLAVPLVLLSGVFGTPAGLPPLVMALTYALPTTPAVRVLLDAPTGTELALLITASVAVSALWFCVARLALGRALRRATVAGTLEVV